MGVKVTKTYLAVFLMFIGLGEAFGHARFTPGYPLILRNPGDNLKNVDNPCGAPPASDPAMRSVFSAGQELEIVFEETVDHPSKYQIAFSPDDTDNFSVILMDEDNIFNDDLRPQDLPNKQDVDGSVNDRTRDPRIYKFTVTLPDTPCERCSLRLIQRMYDQSPPANYFSCADIRLVPADSPEIAPEKPSGVRVLQIQSVE